MKYTTHNESYTTINLLDPGPSHHNISQHQGDRPHYKVELPVGGYESVCL